MPRGQVVVVGTLRDGRDGRLVVLTGSLLG